MQVFAPHWCTCSSHGIQVPVTYIHSYIQSVPGHLERLKQDKVVSFLLVNASLGAYWMSLLVWLLKVINSLKMSSFAPGKMETKQSCVISPAECQFEC